MTETKINLNSLNHYVKWTSDKILDLERQIENLKCCGNCGFLPSVSNICDRYEFGGNGLSGKFYCAKWQSDNLTREDRSK